MSNRYLSICPSLIKCGPQGQSVIWGLTVLQMPSHRSPPLVSPSFHFLLPLYMHTFLIFSSFEPVLSFPLPIIFFFQSLRTMSWQSYVDDYLMCDMEGTDGHCLAAAAIVGHDASAWAQSDFFLRFIMCRPFAFLIGSFFVLLHGTSCGAIVQWPSWGILHGLK